MTRARELYISGWKEQNQEHESYVLNVTGEEPCGQHYCLRSSIFRAKAPTLAAITARAQVTTPRTRDIESKVPFIPGVCGYKPFGQCRNMLSLLREKNPEA
jgi:hypothetical protein